MAPGVDSASNVSVKVSEELHYKPEGREFDSRWCYWDFSLT